jgi:hypothetical protein
MNQESIWRRVLQQIPPGASALVISHGGLIEPALVACLPTTSVQSPAVTGPVDDKRIHDHLRVARLRVRASLAEATVLGDAGFHGAALIWAVRAAEILMRDFVLAPYYMTQGESWERAMRKGSKALGNSDWSGAFKRAEEWFGPFDAPRTTNGEDAWSVWSRQIVRRRGDIVHGRPVPEVTEDEAREVVAFVDRMTTWFPQRFLTSTKHPIGQQLRALLDGSEPRHQDTSEA